MSVDARQDSSPRNRIMEAAAQMFSRQGYHGTSTREIAMVASVNENTLFRHFICKEDLFWLALQSRLMDFEVNKNLKLALAEDSSPEIAIPYIVELLVSAAECHPNDSSDLDCMVGVKREVRPHVQGVPDSDCSLIVKYLTKNVKNKKLRDVDRRFSRQQSPQHSSPQWSVECARWRSCRLSNSKQAITAYIDFWLAILT